PVLDRAHRLPFQHAVRVIDREAKFTAGSHDRAESAEAVCSSRLHRDWDTAPAAGIGAPAPALLVCNQFARPQQHAQRATDASGMQAGMPGRYGPQPWLVINSAASGDVENRLVKSGDFLCLADDGGRVKGHEYLPLNAILSPPDAVPSPETTQPGHRPGRAGF